MSCRSKVETVGTVKVVVTNERQAARIERSSTKAPISTWVRLASVQSIWRFLYFGLGSISWFGGPPSGYFAVGAT